MNIDQRWPLFFHRLLSLQVWTSRAHEWTSEARRHSHESELVNHPESLAHTIATLRSIADTTREAERCAAELQAEHARLAPYISEVCERLEEHPDESVRLLENEVLRLHGAVPFFIRRVNRAMTSLADMLLRNETMAANYFAYLYAEWQRLNDMVEYLSTETASTAAAQGGDGERETGESGRPAPATILMLMDAWKTYHRLNNNIRFLQAINGFSSASDSPSRSRLASSSTSSRPPPAEFTTRVTEAVARLQQTETKLQLFRGGRSGLTAEEANYLQERAKNSLLNPHAAHNANDDGSLDELVSPDLSAEFASILSDMPRAGRTRNLALSPLVTTRQTIVPFSHVRRAGTPNRSLWHSVRSSVPVQALALILLGFASLIPMTEDEFGCLLSNNLGSLYNPALSYLGNMPPF